MRPLHRCKRPGALVLHALGKDAKAIKFMVNIEQDVQPVFTESAQELDSLQGPLWLMMDAKDYNALRHPFGRFATRTERAFRQERLCSAASPLIEGAKSRGAIGWPFTASC